MPYTSDAQRRFFHTDTARRHGISAATTHEFDVASRGMQLPERAKATGGGRGDGRSHAAHRAALRGLASAAGAGSRK
jgi:hypothetical protein